jgi:hypothetical protein
MSIVRHTSHEFVGWQQYVTRFTHGLSHDGLHGSVTHDYWRERRADDNSITGVELRPLLTTGTGSRRKAPPAYKQMAIRGFVPVPYPSIFNGWSGAQRKELPMVAAFGKPRDLLAACMWGPRTTPSAKYLHVYGPDFPHASQQRDALVKQCLERPRQCEFANMTATKKKVKFSISDLTSLMERATFSLQPIGDCFTRKATFDAMAMGSIPVVFDRRSFDLPWFAPNPEVFAVIIDTHVWNISSTENIFDVLSRIPQERVTQMQRSIADAAMRFHYAVDRESCGGEPCHDAYEVAIENLCQLSRNAASVR